MVRSNEPDNRPSWKGGQPMKTKSALMILVIAVLFLVSCISEGYPAPDETADGWQTASPAEVGFDEELLAQAVDRIKDGEYPNVHSMLIVKDGKLVFEEYFDGHVWDYEAERFEGPEVSFDRDTKHTIMSVTKAFTSALIGMAIEEGFIAD